MSTPAAADGPTLRVVVGRSELSAGVRRLAAELSRDYPDGVRLVARLKGSVCFLADLIRAVTVPVEVDFLAISSYAAGSGRVRIVKDLDGDIYDQDVVLVEDIVDTGLTLTYLVGELGRRGPRSIEVCALLDKQSRRIIPASPRYVGFSIRDDFVLGYGLDYAERYRNLDRIVAGDLEVLGADPDAYVPWLYQG